ncbi:6-phospho-beta-glucosidase [Dictyobacter alpinus]|uniref:6-phospho-beta-glucosidase n=1 Tax=Dictyobacter alpinus TaxID=2014873 RepID=A0A402AZS4_9CHLR|nr:hypothetical protein [Dictyobacter alpinus]GCE24606.1 6-phospho-beta-glucosidase [Dictyobacter alpinus]
MTSQANALKNPAHHSHRVKIAIIGGGSLHCATFMQSVIQQPEVLRGCQITLMDIDEESLDLIYTLGTKLFQQNGVEVELKKTTSQEEAIENANFVLTTFRTGGLQSRVIDEKLPLRHNLLGNDTIGAGGFFHALRNAPVIAGIAAEIEKLAPKAFLLNYTSPSNITTEAISHYSGIRVIGLQDNTFAKIATIAQYTGAQFEPPEHLHARKVGLSNANWTTAIWSEGEDVLAQVIQWCEKFIQHKPEMTVENYPYILLATLATRYNAIPSYYMHYYYFPEIVLEYQQKQSQTPTESLLAQLPRMIQSYKQEAQKKHPASIQLPEVPGELGPDDFALSIIRSILNDTGEEWVLNVPNKGSLNFLADDRVVELPCRVDARGATPLTQEDGGLSIDQKGLIAALAEYEGAAARVALWGNRQEAIKALAANPLVWSYSKAEKIYDELAHAHKKFLPQRLFK